MLLKIGKKEKKKDNEYSIEFHPNSIPFGWIWTYIYVYPSFYYPFCGFQITNF